MAQITAGLVKQLRDMTGAGMMDCKRALQDTDGDVDNAAQQLREKGLIKSAERSDREASEGAIGTFLDADKGVAALVELRCETDFVAKNPDFVNLATDLATLAAEGGESAVDQKKGEVDNLKINLKENIGVGRVIRVEGAAGDGLDLYEHRQDGRVKNGVIVELAGAGRDLAHEVAVHVAFARPTYLQRADVPEDVVASERATFETISRNEGKPEAAMSKIVDGRMNGFFKEHCLLDQAYVKDEKQTVGQLLGDSSVVRFDQIEIGR